MLRNIILLKIKLNKSKIVIKKNIENKINTNKNQIKIVKNKIGFKAREEEFNKSQIAKNKPKLKTIIENKEIFINPLTILEDSKYNYDIIDNNLLEIKLDYYIIHLERSINRAKNIEKLNELLNNKLTVFNAIDGYDMQEITDDNIIFKNTIIEAPYTFDTSIKNKLVRGEIGNYLSHLTLLYKLKELNINDGYTIVFEDDIKFKDNLDNKIRGILGKITDDFDILFLGNTRKNCGVQYKDEIHYIDKNNVLWGTYGYLINNKNINKLYDSFNHLYVPTDLIMKDLIDSEKINGFVLAPCIVIQNFKEFPSEIIKRNNNLLIKYLKNKKIKK